LSPLGSSLRPAGSIPSLIYFSLQPKYYAILKILCETHR
jgi:hypothetical protein